MPRQTNTVNSNTGTNASSVNINSVHSINSQSTTSNLDTPSVPMSAYLALLNQQRNTPSEKEPTFSIQTVIALIGIAGGVLLAYFTIQADIKELKEKITTLEKTNTYEQTNKEITNLRNTLNILQTDLSRYNFKTMNDTIIKLDTDMSYIKNNSNQKNSKN